LSEVSGPGFSGATLESVTLNDGTRLVVKRISPSWDMAMRATHDRGRAATLWTSGALDRLPPSIDHAIVAAEPEGDGWVIVMRDVSSALLPEGHSLTRAQFRRVFAAARDMHRAYRGVRIDDLCTLTDHLSTLTPAAMAQFADRDDWLPRMLPRGWELFDDLVPNDIAAAVRAIHARPALLAAELERSWTTMLHGDLWIANFGLLPERVVFLDWGLATCAPPVLEFTMFLTGCWSRVTATRDEMITDIRALYGDDHDERALQLAFIATFSEFGWNKALDVVEHPDPALRAQEEGELHWWIATVRAALESTWSPV
jgi:aminoglycoside phosphotransferase (APT) family kinase protein